MIILPFFKFVLQSAEYHGLTVRQVCFVYPYYNYILQNEIDIRVWNPPLNLLLSILSTFLEGSFGWPLPDISFQIILQFQNFVIPLSP